MYRILIKESEQSYYFLNEEFNSGKIALIYAMENIETNKFLIIKIIEFIEVK